MLNRAKVAGCQEMWVTDVGWESQNDELLYRVINYDAIREDIRLKQVSGSIGASRDGVENEVGEGQERESREGESGYSEVAKDIVGEAVEAELTDGKRHLMVAWELRKLVGQQQHYINTMLLATKTEPQKRARIKVRPREITRKKRVVMLV